MATTGVILGDFESVAIVGPRRCFFRSVAIKELGSEQGTKLG